MGWFDDVVHAVTHPGSLVSDAEHGLGTLIDDGAHVLGSGLSAVGLTGAGQWLDRAGDNVANFLGAQVPEEQLGQTTDPAELIHGDPGALRSTASQLRTFGASFAETAAGLAGIDTGHWTGAAADAFRARYAPQPGRWRAASTACGGAAGALESYAGTVQWAQGQAREAIAVYQEGQRATTAAVATYNGNVAAYNQAARLYDSALAAGRNPGARPVEPGPFTDPGMALRERAQQILAAARAERDAAGARAAATVRSATDLAPAEPSFGQQLLDDLHDAGEADLLAGVSFGSGLLTGAADLVKTARAVDPLDPWNVTHLAEYGAGMSGLAAGLVHDAVHPQDAVEGLVGTGWGSDPAEAAGKLVPSLALAALTDGAGAEADAARPAPDMALQADPVDVASGDVVLAQTDVRLPGALPLTVARVHRSSWQVGRWFGRSWLSTLDQRLEVSERGVCFAAAAGMVLRYPHPGENGGPVFPAAGKRWPLTRDTDGGYTVTDPQAGLVWRFAPRSGYYLSAAGHGEVPLVSVADRAGHQITVDYDLNGTPVAVHDDGGYRITVLTAGDRATGLDLAGAGPDGADLPLVRYGYDAAGNLSEIVNSSGRPQLFWYDEAGRLTGWQDRNGWGYRYGYGADGRCVRGEGPDGALSGTFCYDRDNLITSYTDAAGAVTGYQLTEAFGVAAVTGPLGSVTRSEYDASGRLVSRTDPLGRVTRWGYDDTGNLTAVIRPDGSKATAVYNEANLPVLVIEPGGAPWRQEYDAKGNLALVTAPDGAVTSYAYDGRGHLAGVTDPDGAQTQVECDAAGLPVAVAGPDGAVTKYARDGFGRVTSVTQADGSVARMAWTTEGRLASRTFPNGSAESFSYDGDLRFERDPAGRVTAETCNGHAVRSSYDVAGRRVRRLTPSGAESRWSYDAAGRPVTLQAAGQSITFGYDHSGRETARHLPGGVTLAQDWNPNGRLASQLLTNGTGPALQHRGYRYRADGALTGVDDLLAGPRRFALDAAGRVTGVAGPGWAESYGYDPAGNLTAAAWPAPPPGITAAWADPGVQGERQYSGTLITRAGDVRYRHDPGGRVVMRQRVRLSRKPDTWHYSWDAEDRLTSVTTPDGTVWQYRYDPLGRRIAKERLFPDGQVTEQTQFTWDGPTLAEQATMRPFSATPGAVGPTPRWRAPAETRARPHRREIVTWDYRPGSVTPLTQTERRDLRHASQPDIDECFYAIVTDLIGTPSELVGVDGNLAGYQQHTLWGTTIWKPGGAATPLRFPGQYADPETGLHYNNHRYYDPLSGGYLTPDPLGLTPAPNPHAYVPNPTTRIDPLGLMGADCIPGAGNAAEDESDLVNLASDSRTEHILYGDETGGGHLWPGLPGKTPFPAEWSAARVMGEISDVATDPAAWEGAIQQGSLTVLVGTRGGVEIRVIVNSNTYDIITGYSINLPRNP